MEKVVVLDFGGQYARLIARRVRECSVYSEILPYDASLERIMEQDPQGIILSGGPWSVYAEEAPVFDERILTSGVPILGICYGMQLIAAKLGGEVDAAKRHEYGKSTLTRQGGSVVLDGLPESFSVWMSHADYVGKAPTGFTVTGYTENAPVAAFESQEKHIFAVQFHPEVMHTTYGTEILKNFLFTCCRCYGSWTMESFVEEAVRDIRETVGDGKAVCALSGGVDSLVAAALVHRAIGDRLTAMFVDHGLLRKEEPERVFRTFDSIGIRVKYIDAKERFLKALRGVTDPEQKRKIIGREFINVFEEEAEKLGKVDFLVQGTVYPDVIESGTKTAAVIKSHHNVGGLPQEMNLSLIEPLRNLFKDEVRLVAEELGLPEAAVWRQPFPGPGLAIRILGEITPEKLRILRDADYIVVQEMKRAGLYRKLWQTFAVLPNIKSVGVMGDGRTYAHLIALRAVSSEDGMTADWARLPYEVLERISTRVLNEVEGVNRFVYDITSKPPGTIEWE